MSTFGLDPGGSGGGGDEEDDDRDRQQTDERPTPGEVESDAEDQEEDTGGGGGVPEFPTPGEVDREADDQDDTADGGGDDSDVPERPTPGQVDEEADDQDEKADDSGRKDEPEEPDEKDTTQTIDPGGVPGQGVEVFGRTDTIRTEESGLTTFREEAQRIESAFLEDQDRFGAEDVAVFFSETDEDVFQPEIRLTESGAAISAAEAIRGMDRVPSDAVDIVDGDVDVDLSGIDPDPASGIYESGADPFAADVPQLGDVEERLGFPGVGGAEEAFGVDTGPGPRTDIESSLEDATGVDLGPNDITFDEVERDGETVITGELSREGRKTVEQETAFEVFQNTPLEGPTETLAGLGFEFDEFRRENRERLFDRVPSLEDEFEERVPDLSREFDDAVPKIDIGTKEVAAAAALGVAAPEPATTVGGAAVLTALGAGAIGLDRAMRDGDVEAPAVEASEIDLPKSGELFVESEAGLPSRPGLFDAEIGLPDPQQQTFLGVPEQGIEIEVGERQSPVSTTEVDPPTDTGTDPFPTEVDVPTDTGTDPFQSTSSTAVRSGTQRRPEQGDPLSVPQPSITGDESGLGAPFGGRAVFRGRQPKSEAELVDPYEKFLGFGEAGGLLEEAQEPLVTIDEGISAPESMPGELSGSMSSAGAAARAESASDASVAFDDIGKLGLDTSPSTMSNAPATEGLDSATKTALDRPLETETGNPPGLTSVPFEPLGPAFDLPPVNRTVEEPRYPGLPVPPGPPGFEGKPLKFPLLKPDSDLGDKKRRRGDLASDLFTNIDADLDELGADLDDDLEGLFG